MKIRQFAPLAAASLVAASLSFAPAAQAADPIDVVNSPYITVADDGSFTYAPGEWTGATNVTAAWFSCPSAQAGAIGAVADLTQQLTDAGCVQISTDKTLPADTFDNVTSFPVIMEVADDTLAAYMGNSFIMYDKSAGPILYSTNAQAALERTLYFSGNSATLNRKSRSALYGLLGKIGSTSTAEVTINAYAAKGGSAAKNASLARGRARQIMFFFKKNGIYGPFKIKLHVSTQAGQAGRKATVAIKVIDPVMPQ